MAVASACEKPGNPMALAPVTNRFRSAALALALGTAAMGIAPASAQQITPVAAPPATQTVSEGNCAAFFHYIADEARTFPDQLSREFLSSALRFKRANCAASDKDGPIYIITMTDQDAASLRTSLRRMGKFDIIGVSGVKGCHRPPGNACPVTTGSNARPAAGG